MKVTTLVENTTLSKNFENKHGLCLHIKTANHNILFDLGSDDLFIRNANKLNIDISDVDIVIISHGHKDHGGGLNSFLQYNKKAKIYIHKNAFQSHYISAFGFLKFYCGLDNNLQNNDRIILTDKNFRIDEELYLFSDVPKENQVPPFNKALLKKVNNKYLQDDLDHEQSLILKENNKYILIAGCSHNGITNILAKAEQLVSGDLSKVISGFHLFNPVTRKHANVEFINDIGNNLATKKTTFYTCHCTGIKPFNILQEKLGNKINYLSTGQIIDI